MMVPLSNPHELPTPELLSALTTAGLAADLDLMRACLARVDDLRPHLLRLLGAPPEKGATAAPAAIHAGHLLLAGPDPEALPLFVEIFRDASRKAQIEWFVPWLHEYGAALVDPLLAVVGDAGAYGYGRAAATEVLAATGRRFPETKAAIVGGLGRYLPAPAVDAAAAEIEPEPIWSWIAVALARLGAEEALPRLETLHRAGRLDPEITGTWEAYRADFGSGGREPRPFNLLDVYRYLHKQAAYRQAQQVAEAEPSTSEAHRRPAPGEPTVRALPKVGRNEPCPCGSGRKYKRCHGRPGR